MTSPEAQAMSSTADTARSTPPPSEVVRDIEWSRAPFIVGSGFCMGTADVVPGVSGGTMAVALGIYRQLLAAIASIDVSAVRALLRLRLPELFARVHWRFLGMLALGMGLGIGVMVKVVGLPELIQTSPQPVYATFFGLVLASALILARRIPTWNAGRAGSLALGAALGFAVVNLVPVSTPESGLFVFFSGLVAICAMLLPGISGSFILLILGKYAYVLGALSRLDLGVILPFVAGCAVGVVAFSRVVSWAMARFHDTVVAGLTGLLLGSLWRIWPYQHLTTKIVREKPRVIAAEPFVPASIDLSVVGLCVGAAVAVLLLERLARTRAA
jgi:putative membrane protein